MTMVVVTIMCVKCVKRVKRVKQLDPEPSTSYSPASGARAPVPITSIYMGLMGGTGTVLRLCVLCVVSPLSLPSRLQHCANMALSPPRLTPAPEYRLELAGGKTRHQLQFHTSTTHTHAILYHQHPANLIVKSWGHPCCSCSDGPGLPIPDPDPD